MTIQSLRLQNFRNIQSLSLDFPQGFIGIVGENAQGKTNLLESLYLLSAGSSWRGISDGELIRESAPFCRIDGSVTSNDETSRLALVVQRQEGSSLVKKTYLVNDIKRKKETFTSHFATVLFYPEDISLIIGSPSQRRKVIDYSLAEAYPHYNHLVTQYGKVITSRNRVLDRIRDREATVSQLEYWTTTLVQLASEIYYYRYAFFEFIKSCVRTHEYVYLPAFDFLELWGTPHFVEEVKKRIEHKIHQNIQKEILSATSQYGPHKDDFAFYLGEKDLSLYGSRGEQRAALFGFKKMQLLYIEQVRGDKPVLLLDDIFSEFDFKHRQELRDLCQGYQTFITGTEDQFFLKEGFNFETIVRVNNGEAFLSS